MSQVGNTISTENKIFKKIFSNFSEVISLTTYYLYKTVKEAFEVFDSVQNFHQLPYFFVSFRLK